MKATDVISLYKKGAKACSASRPQSWLRLLFIASKGEAGCQAQPLFSTGRATPCFNALNRWVERGLVVTWEKKQGPGRPQRWVRITPKGLAMLGVTE